jgi:hypothetical protein
MSRKEISNVRNNTLLINNNIPSNSQTQKHPYILNPQNFNNTQIEILPFENKENQSFAIDLQSYYDAKTYNKLKTCDKNQKCSKYFVCDLDTNKCLSTDIIPYDSHTEYDGKRIAGSGKILIEYLISKGMSLDDIINNKDIYKTRNMNIYIDHIKKLKEEILISKNNPLINKELKNINDKIISKETIYNIPSQDIDGTKNNYTNKIFSNIVQIQKLNISTYDWPKILTMIPDFLFNNNKMLSSYLYTLPETYYSNYDNVLPKIKCLINLLYNNNFISKLPDTININRYIPQQNTHKDSSEAVSLENISSFICFGSPALMRFTTNSVRIKIKTIDIPILPGCLLIINNQQKDVGKKPNINWKYQIMNDAISKYSAKSVKTSSWKNSIRIIVSLNNSSIIP